MNLNQIVKDATELAFAKCESVATPMSYSEPGDYDPVTGTLSAGVTRTYTAILSNYTLFEVNNSTVMGTDVKCVLHGERPFTTGKITDGSTVYQIVNIESDPTNYVHTLQLRR